MVHTQEHPLAAAKRWCETYGDAWVGVAFAPAGRLVVALGVGNRTPEPANFRRNRVVAVTDDHVPFFTSDQWPASHRARRQAAGDWYQPERQGPRGR